MLLLTCWPGLSWAAMVTVAPADAPQAVKDKADLVCDGKDDQVELLASFTRARTMEAAMDRNPGEMRTVKALGKHSVEWLPGDYHLGGTLVIPPAADCVIQAEGAHFFYKPDKGDAIVLTGMLRCVYHLGTVHTQSDGSALAIRPTAQMAALSSDVTFRGLIGKDQKGNGFHIDPSVENVCINRFEGVDVYGFNHGVLVEPAGTKNAQKVAGIGKCDGNWWWMSNVRRCTTCYAIAHKGVDSNVWNLNVDASLPGTVGLRTGELHGKYYLIMGTWHNEGKNPAVILDAGAEHNVIEVHPPIEMFLLQDNSGNDTNVMLTTARPPYRQKK